MASIATPATGFGPGEHRAFGGHRYARNVVQPVSTFASGEKIIFSTQASVPEAELPR